MCVCISGPHKVSRKPQLFAALEREVEEASPRTFEKCQQGFLTLLITGFIFSIA